MKTELSPFQRVCHICQVGLVNAVLTGPATNTGRLCRYRGEVPGWWLAAPWTTRDSHWGRVPGQEPPCCCPSWMSFEDEAWHLLLSTALHHAAGLSPSSPCRPRPPPHPCSSSLPTSLPIHLPKARTNQKTNAAAAAAARQQRWRRGEQGTCLHFPSFPDPNLNPRSASCQPGCSQADIAAGAFSAAFPQICLLRGLLKRSPRFLCYSRLHSLPSSKAGAPRGPRSGSCSGAAPGLTFWRKRGGWRWLDPRGFRSEGQP